MQLALDELKNENDTSVEDNGITVIFDSSLERYVSGAVVDYSNNWMQKGFVIRGGQTSSC